MVDERHATIGSACCRPAGEDLGGERLGEKIGTGARVAKLAENEAGEIETEVHFEAFEEQVREEATTRIVGGYGRWYG